MTGANKLSVVFDVSGSFNELGKHKLIGYIATTVANVALMPRWNANIKLYEWREDVQEIQNINLLSGKGIAKFSALKAFCSNLGGDDKLIVVSDGLFGEKISRIAPNIIKNENFCVVAAGYDADISALKKLGGNLYLAEDIVSALYLMDNIAPAIVNPHLSG